MRLTNLGVIPSNKSWLSGYDYGKEIIIPANSIDEELINFPCTVYLDDTNFDFSKAKSDGSDIRFTDSRLNQLKFERVEHVKPTILFKSGIEETTISGGFTKQITSTSGSIINNGTNIAYTYARGQAIGAYNSYAEAVVMSVNPIDLTSYKTINIEVTESAPSRLVGLKISSTNLIPTNAAGGERNTVIATTTATLTTGVTKVISLDVSNINTTSYVFFTAVTDSANGTPNPTGIISRFWLSDGLTDTDIAVYTVQIPTVSSIKDTKFYMWYGNSNAYNTSIESWQDQTGKQLTYYGNVKMSNSYLWQVPENVTSLEVLVVGGGGYSVQSTWGYGGGGGGGIIYHTSKSVTPGQKLRVQVGRGGGTWESNNGENSIFDDLTGYGGGAAGAVDGGSGGGGGHTGVSGEYGKSIQTSHNGGTGYGNAGGTNTYASPYPCGSGGGAGSAGSNGGPGGAGRAFSITGTSIYYGGGGGSCNNSGVITAGGVGGGGTGGPGTDNLGGGAGASQGTYIKYSGGSGVIIVKYIIEESPTVVTFTKDNIMTLCTIDDKRVANFDGTGDYFECRTALDSFTSTSDKFTIEAIVNHDNTVTGEIFGLNSLSAGENILLLETSQITYNGTPNSVILPANTINHVALVFDGTNLKYYINGVLSLTLSGSPSIPLKDCTFAIGTEYDTANYGSPGNYLIGTVYGARVTKSDRYTSNFTPPDNFEIDDSDVVFCTNFDTIYDSNYTMVQHMGDSLIDATGNGNNGTATGTSVVNTYYGRSRNFNGTSDYIQLPNDLGYTNAFTACAWFKALGTPAGGYHIIFGGQELEISIPTSGALRIGLYTTSRYVDNYGSGLTNGDWHHVCMTFDGTKKKGYIDGILVGEASVTGTLMNSFNRTIGRYGTDTSYYTNGFISNVKIYNIARSDAWIKAESLVLKDNILTIEDLNIVTDGLILHLDVGNTESYSGSGIVWYDLSDNSHNGTLVNGVSYNASNNGYLTFDGTDDYIDLGSFFTYQTFTIDIWVNTGSTQNTYADIFDNNHTGSRNFVCQQIDVNTNLYNFGVMDATGTISHTGNFTLSPNVWTNLTFTFTPSDRVKLYVNGYLSASGALANNRNILYESQTLSIGRWGAGTGRNWNGNMSNFKAYNKVLSSTEVLQNYKALRRRYI